MGVGVFTEIQNDLDQVYILMQNELKSDQRFLDQIISYLLQKRGKMMRPALVILSGKICGGDTKYLVQFGAAMEILHIATLIHDDIIDKAEIRRGLKTVNNIFSSQIAVLLGDFFYARSLKILTKTPYCGFDLISNIVANMVQGEFMQYENSFKLPQDIGFYWRLIKYKTAIFISNCCRLGAMSSNCSEQDLDALTLYGQYLGMAFQICDDILDFSSEPQKLGKPVYKDVTNGIYTLPILHALKFSDEKDILCEILKKDRFTNSDYQLLVKMLQKSGSLDYAYNKAERLCNTAREKLKIFKPSKEKDILESLTYFNLQREF